jgi:hypothetical protein
LDHLLSHETLRHPPAVALPHLARLGVADVVAGTPEIGLALSDDCADPLVSVAPAVGEDFDACADLKRVRDASVQGTHDAAPLNARRNAALVQSSIVSFSLVVHASTAAAAADRL